MDEHMLNPIPKGKIRKLRALVLSSRYSMPVLMRLSQLFFIRYSKSTAIKRCIYALLHSLVFRINQVCNHFEHGGNPHIAPGVVFHHSGVCITSGTIIEKGVHLYRNITFGSKNGQAPHIKKYARIASHSIVIGNVVVGEKAIVAPGAVVVNDVPPNKIAAGVPAKVIGDVTEENYYF